ncbi:hypothetical protein GGS24DRAFT_305414 [Hypoxylon argillaceum]|nr:hypothetical protein GGS24DRAFT_305414 [Hypoxylon argillaceum]
MMAEIDVKPSGAELVGQQQQPHQNQNQNQSQNQNQNHTQSQNHSNSPAPSLTPPGGTFSGPSAAALTAAQNAQAQLSFRRQRASRACEVSGMPCYMFRWSTMAPIPGTMCLLSVAWPGLAYKAYLGRKWDFLAVPRHLKDNTVLAQRSTNHLRSTDMPCQKGMGPPLLPHHAEP